MTSTPRGCGCSKAASGFDEGDIVGARAAFDAVRPLVEQFEDEETLARLLANLCTCDLRLGNVAEGRASGAQAAALFAELGMETEALLLFWSVAEALATTDAQEVALDPAPGNSGTV